MFHKEKRQCFATPCKPYRPIYYLEIPLPRTDDAIAQVLLEVERCHACGCATLIPQLPYMARVTSMEEIAYVREVLAAILERARALDLQVGFHLDYAFEEIVIQTMDDLGETHMHAKVLERKEYICREGENLSRPLHEGELVSLVAYSELYGEVVDLRPFIVEGKLCWTVPRGNWVVQEYLVLPEEECRRANYLSHEASYHYIKAVLTLFWEVLAPYVPTTVTLLAYSGIGFHGENRRDWDPSFNTLFEKRFGYDPAPNYPSLFGYMGVETTHVKAQMMTVRASMIQHGIMQALYDVAQELGLSTFGALSEPKLTACSFLSGDAMLNNSYSPCALFDKAYLYGINSVKIAAGAAYNFDIERVNAELFRNYSRKDKTRLLRDAMNAFARGANNTALHLTPELSESDEFCTFTARVQTMLRGGKHVADIAMLYPIYDLHSHVTLYFSPTEAYEYPPTPATADYMTLINSISFYAGHDLTVLHPKALATRCHTDRGVLYLDNEVNREEFRIVVLPATEMISLESIRLLKAFYDGGGKILATGVLPTKAFEYDGTDKNDLEVQRLTREIFGKDACDPRVMRRYCQNKNEAGGEAIFLYFNTSAADGTQMVKSSTVNSALNAFDIPFDIYMPGMQRSESTGALNCIYPEYHTIGLHRTFPGAGMLNHIHKKTAEGDIYYFANSTDREYNHHVLLRGVHRVEEWDPHTGEIRERKSKLISHGGELYTNVRLTLPSSRSTFFCTVPDTKEGKEITYVDSITRLESEHAMLMSEF